MYLDCPNVMCFLYEGEKKFSCITFYSGLAHAHQRPQPFPILDPFLRNHAGEDKEEVHESTGSQRLPARPRLLQIWSQLRHISGVKQKIYNSSKKYSFKCEYL